jgi:hypothetical protein
MLCRVRRGGARHPSTVPTTACPPAFTVTWFGESVSTQARWGVAAFGYAGILLCCSDEDKRGTICRDQS